MNPAQNDRSEELKTPIKQKYPSYAEFPRFINSPEKPKKADFVAEVFQDPYDQCLEIFSIRKPDAFCSESISISEDEYDQSNNESEKPSSEEEKYQTVKKVLNQNLKANEQVLITPAAKNKKGCNCDKTKCIKGYCVCYKNGATCSKDCECQDCQNQLITSQHFKNEKKNLELSKVCNCKNSQCLKKYCICWNSGRKCSDACRCLNCHNPEEGGQNDEERYQRGVRLQFTVRKKIKTSEFEFELQEQNCRIYR